MKIGLEVLTPVQLAAIRLSIGGMIFLPVVLRHFRELDRQGRIFVVIAGLCGNGIPAFLFAIGQTHVNSSIAGALNALTPIFTLIIGVLFTSMVLSRLKILGILIGFLGAIAIILGRYFTNQLTGNTIQSQDILESGPVIYTLLIVLATLLYGTNINIIKSKLSRYRAIAISTLPLFFMGIPSLFIVITSDWSNVEAASAEQNLHSIGAIVALALFGNSLSLYLFNRLIQMSGPVFASSVTYFIPIVALFLGLQDHETILPVQYAGIVLILLGVYLLRRGRNQEERTS